MKPVEGGVCAPLGFKAGGVCCGIKNWKKRDLALIVSENRAACACCYTTNLVKGAPIYVTRENTADGYARAIICNSGNANTCAEGGAETARKICALTSLALGIDAGDVVIASTGVIGQRLDIGPIERGLPELAASLSREGSALAAEAIMTTDTFAKEVSAEFSLSGITCRVGGMAKGSGMISPNMATMLSFITTDAAVSPEMLQMALSEDVKNSYNMVSVDGDTSTNDMVTILANGLAGNPEITEPCEDFSIFKSALKYITSGLCRMIARDGEGATKLLKCDVTGAESLDTARKIAKTVINSPLIKTAMFGADANWGRVLCAIGYAGVSAGVDRTRVAFSSASGTVTVCENGHGVSFSEEDAKKILSQDEVVISVSLADGDCSATALGCDLTYDYVKINGDYRT